MSRTKYVAAAALLSFFIALPVLAEEEAEPKAFLWEVKSPTSTVYILGSIPFMRRMDYPLKDVIENAFSNSDTLVVELNPLTANKIRTKQDIRTKGVYKEGKSLKSDLNERVLDLLKKHLAKDKMPIEDMMKLKPGLIAMALTSKQLMDLGFYVVFGIDAYFAKKAKDKEIIEFRTTEEHLSLFLDTSNGNLLLKHTLLCLADMEQKMDKVITAWKTGDFDEMNNLTLEEPLKKHPELLPIFKEMVFDRSEEMAQQIDGFLKTGKTYFVIVGVTHLVGDKSILNILRQAKYSVSQF